MGGSVWVVVVNDERSAIVIVMLLSALSGAVVSGVCVWLWLGTRICGGG